MLISLLWATSALFTTRELLRLVIDQDPEPALNEHATEVLKEGAPPSPLLRSSEIDQMLALSVGSLACAGAGLVGPSLFRTWSVVFTLGGGAPLFRRSWRRMPCTPDYADLVLAQGVVSLFLGFPGFAALGWLSYAGSRRLLEMELEYVSSAPRVEEPAFDAPAWLVDGDVEMELPLDELVVGDQIFVRAREPVPVDGTLVEGFVRVRPGMLANEHEGRELGPGDRIRAGSEVLQGAAVVVVDREHQRSLVARVSKWLAEPASSARVHNVELATERSVPLSFGLGMLASLSAGSIGLLEGMRCNFSDLPYLGVPLLALNARQGTSELTRGLVDPEALGGLQGADTVVLELDALREQQLALERVHAQPGWRADELLMFAGAARQDDAQGAAILRVCRERGITPPVIEAYGDARGLGLELRVDGARVLVGGERLMRAMKIGLPLGDTLQGPAAPSLGVGARILEYIAVDGQYAGFIEFRARLRRPARRIADGLRERGLELVLVSAADERTTGVWARELGISSYLSEASAADKLGLVVALQEAGDQVAYVGSQASDTLALRQATAGISLGPLARKLHRDVAITLDSEDLENLEDLFELGAAFAHRRKLIVVGAQAQTLAASLGLLALGSTFPLIVYSYTAGLAYTVLIALAPLSTPMPPVKALTSE